MKIKSFMQKDRYGNSTSVEFFEDNTIPSMMDIPMYDHPGDPKGTDTVPAWLTPGEYVVNAEAVRMFEPQIEAMNEAGREVQRSQGGTIPSYEADGGPIYAQAGEVILPLGLRQRNPGNIRPGANFIGESGANDGYAVFNSDEEGLRAIQRLLQTYGNKYNINTLEGFANRYAPPSDNNPTSNYIDYLSQQTGIAPNEKINLAERGADLIPAIVGFEQGQMPYTPEQINLAIQAAGTDDPEEVRRILAAAQEQQVASSSWNPFSWLIGSAEAQSTVPTTQAPPLPTGSSGSGQVLPNAAAQAAGMVQTPNVATANGLVGMLFENPVYADDMGEYIIGPEGDSIYLSEDQSQAVTRGAVPPPVTPPTLMQLEVEKEKAAVNEAARIESLLNQGDYGVHDRIIRKGSVYNYDEESGNYIDKEGRVYTRDPLEFILDLPNVITAAQNKVRKPSLDQENDILVGKTPNGKDVYQDNENGRYYTIFGPDKNIKRALPRWQEDEIIFNDPSNRPVMPAPDSPYLDEDRSQLPLLPGTEELVPDAAIPPKPEEDKVVSEIKDIIDAANANSDTGNPPATNQFTAEQLDILKANGLGVDENGNIIQLTPDDNMTTKVKGYFTQMFNDLFSGPELARMAVMYAGSRALGYDHGGSISYAMKNYLKRVDAEVAARQEFITDKDNLEDYTEASLQEYRKTGDLSVLEPKTTGYSAIGMGDNIWHEEFGLLPTVKVGDGEYVVEYGSQYYPFSHPLMKGKTHKSDPNLHDSETISKHFFDRAELTLKQLKAKYKDDEITLDSDIVQLGDDAARLYENQILIFGRNPSAQKEIKNKITEAQTRFLEEYALHKIDSDNPEPKSIEVIYNQLSLPLKSRGAIDAELIRPIDSEKFALLDQQIKNAVVSIRGNQPSDPAMDAKNYISTWKAFEIAWKQRGKNNYFDGKMGKNDKHTDFSYFVESYLNPGSDAVSQEAHNEAKKLFE